MTSTLKIGLQAVGPLEAKLSSFARLGADEIALIRGRLTGPQAHPARTELLDGGNDEIRLVASGWAGVSRVLADGRRQILRVALPGDFVSHPPLIDTKVVALTAVRSFDAKPLLNDLERDPASAPGMREALQRAQVDLQRDLLNQVVRLGSLTAYERTANLLAELLRRHQRAGLGDSRRMPWPITQEILSDILGLSIVHVNRVLQQLRRDKLIELCAGVLAAPSPDRLAEAGMVAEGPPPRPA